MGLTSFVVSIAILAGIATPVSARTGNTVCAIHADGAGVYRWDAGSWSWKWIGRDAMEIYGGGLGLFATNPGNSRFYKYIGNGEGGVDAWEPIGSGGNGYAVTNYKVYGIAQDGNSIWCWEPPNSDWYYVGGGGKAIYAGADDSVYRHDKDGVWQYKGYWGLTPRWDRVADESPSLAVGGVGDLYTVGRNGEAVWNWRDDRWTRLGDGASKVFAGGWGMVATDPSNQNMWRHIEGDRWEKIGQGAEQAAISDFHLYARNIHGQVYRWTGNGMNWDELPWMRAKSITPCP